MTPSASTSIATRSCSPLASRTPRPCSGSIKSVDEIILSIDGLQPEKGHETLYVVRELTQKRAWFAEALISATADEVRRLIARAKGWAEALGKPVGLWLSDRQDAFVTGIAAEFPGVPHRYCQNHFLRDVAKPVSGDRQPCQGPDAQEGARPAEDRTGRAQAAGRRGAGGRRRDGCRSHDGGDRSSRRTRRASQADAAGAVVLDYCAAVRGILNDDQGGPLRPPGLRMAEALDEVRASIQRDLDEKKGGSRRSNSAAWPAASTEASTKSGPNKRRSATTSRTSRKSRRPSIPERGAARTAGRSSRS